MPPLTDILHKTLVVGLLGATVADVGVGWKVHKDTLRRGQVDKKIFDAAVSEGLTVEQVVWREQELAEAAQNIFRAQK